MDSEDDSISSIYRIPFSRIPPPKRGRRTASSPASGEPRSRSMGRQLQQLHARAVPGVVEEVVEEGLVAREVDHLLRVLLRQVAAEQHRADMCTRHAVVEPYRAELFEFLANSKKKKKHLENRREQTNLLSKLSLPRRPRRGCPDLDLLSLSLSASSLPTRVAITAVSVIGCIQSQAEQDSRKLWALAYHAHKHTGACRTSGGGCR